MSEERSSTKTRQIAFVLSGLFDSILGAALLLIWVGFLPLNPAELGVPRWVVGIMGVSLFFPGVVIVTYQLTKPRPPE